MEKLLVVFKWFLGCRHGQLSRVFTIDRRTYRVCCDCGAQFDYCLENMTMRRQCRRSMAGL
jgi:hypothetical protein